MKKIVVNTGALDSQAASLAELQRMLSGISSQVQSINRSLTWVIPGSIRFKSQLAIHTTNVEQLGARSGHLSSALNEISSSYSSVEHNLSGKSGSGGSSGGSSGGTGSSPVFPWGNIHLPGYWPLLIPFVPYVGPGILLGPVIFPLLAGDNGWSAYFGTSTDFLHREGKIEKYATNDPEKGIIGAGIGASGCFSLLHHEGEGRIGNFSGNYDVDVGTVKGEGKAAIDVMKDGRLDPSVDVHGKVEATALSGSANAQYGSDDMNVHVSGEGAVGKAEAEASFKAGLDGIGGKAEVGAAALSGEVTTGFTIFGLKFDTTAKGEAGAIGAGAEFGVTDNSIEIGGKLSFIAGLGLKIKVSW